MGRYISQSPLLISCNGSTFLRLFCREFVSCDFARENLRAADEN